ncbi:hypothetical protein JTE90_006330 [Oedothorax gibbosus]|uniref:Uncharacterized protein n=1 Tax=Oedothorax gibbosus TaxID=931172 RepID=A0AAV6TJH4_9ARAC|nr:hypothetical protein JTE90_006330 [Oedothorax gibbosus]
MDSSMVEPESALHEQQNMFVRRYPLPKSDYKSGRNKFRKYCIRLCKESLITGKELLVIHYNKSQSIFKSFLNS